MLLETGVEPFAQQSTELERVVPVQKLVVMWPFWHLHITFENGFPNEALERVVTNSLYEFVKKWWGCALHAHCKILLFHVKTVVMVHAILN